MITEVPLVLSDILHLGPTSLAFRNIFYTGLDVDERHKPAHNKSKGRETGSEQFCGEMLRNYWTCSAEMGVEREVRQGAKAAQLLSLLLRPLVGICVQKWDPQLAVFSLR